MDDELTEYANLPSRNDSESDFSDNEMNELVDDYESPSEDMERTNGQPYHPYPGKHCKYLQTTDSVEQDIYEEEPQREDLWETQNSNPHGEDGNMLPSFSNFENRNFHNTAGINVKPSAFKKNLINLPPQSIGLPPFISKQNPNIIVRQPIIQPPTSLHVRQPLQTFPQPQKVKPLQSNLVHRVKEPNINFPTRQQQIPLKKEIGNFQKVTPNRFPIARGAPSIVHQVSQPDVVRPLNPQATMTNFRGRGQPPISQNIRNKFQNIGNPNLREPSPVSQSVRPWKIQPSVPSSVIGGNDFHHSVLNNNHAKQVPNFEHSIPQQEVSRSVQPWQKQQPVPHSVIGSVSRNDQSVFNQNAIKQKIQNTLGESSPVMHPKFQQNTPKVQPWKAQQSIPPFIASSTFKDNPSISDQNTLNNQNFKNFNKPPPPLVPKPIKSSIDFTNHSSPSALRKISAVGKVTTEQENLTLDDGKEIPMTELYRSLLKEKYFHLISKPSAKDYLPDGTFLLRPSTTRSEEKPLTLCLRYSGRVFVFSVEKRKNGCYSVGVEKEGEMQFSTVQEMISHYRNNPFYFEGVETYFVHPGTEPPSLNH